MIRKFINKIKNPHIFGSIIVICIYIFFLFYHKIYPFGNNTILISDLKLQYIDFLCYFKQILLGNKGIFMSWNLGLANHFYTNFFWQLSNPLNLLVLFFNNNNMHICVEIIIFIKIILIYNSFILYLKKVHNYTNLDSIIFGIAYSFCSYVIIYFPHFMFLDVLYILPIAIIFLDKYIKENKKIWPLILIYIYSLFIQYYMAYSMIIFCSLYYICLFWIKNDFTKQNFKIFIKKGILLFVYTLLCVGVAMVIFIPILSILSNISTLKTSFIYTEYFNLLDFINCFTNNFNYDNLQHLGFYFCSSLITVLTITFFFCKNIKIKEKLIYLIFIIFLIVPAISPVLYKLWHGGTSTNGFSFRYHYTLMFIFVVISFKCYKNLNLNKYKIIFLYIFFSICFVLDVINKINIFFLNLKQMYIPFLIAYIIIFFCFTIICLNLYLKKLDKILKIILFIIQLIEICFFFVYNFGTEYTIEDINSQNNLLQSFVQNIELPELNRIIFENSEYTPNLSLSNNFSTFSFFASGRNINTLLNMNKVGYTTFYNCFSEVSKTIVNDMLSGIKYYYLQDNSNNYNSFLEFMENKNNYSIYKNNYSFPFIYYLNNNINTSNYLNPFEVQNQILNEYGKKTEEKFIYNIKDDDNILLYETKENNITDSKYYNYQIEYNLNSRKNVELYIYYELDEQSRFGYEHIRFETNYNNTPYINYIGISPLTKCIVFPPNTTNNLFSKHQIEHICTLNEGENYWFKINLNTEDFNPEKLEIYVFDVDKIKRKISSANQNIANIYLIGKNNLEATVDLDQDGFICFEIAYDEGWNLVVDGTKMPTTAIYDCFLGTELSKGEHNVKIYYVPKGFYLGCTLSILSVSILVFCYFYTKKYKLL